MAGGAWPGAAGLGVARHGEAGQGFAWLARHGTARHGGAWLGTARKGWHFNNPGGATTNGDGTTYSRKENPCSLEPPATKNRYIVKLAASVLGTNPMLLLPAGS